MVVSMHLVNSTFVAARLDLMRKATFACSGVWAAGSRTFLDGVDNIAHVTTQVWDAFAQAKMPTSKDWIR